MGVMVDVRYPYAISNSYNFTRFGGPGCKKYLDVPKEATTTTTLQFNMTCHNRGTYSSTTLIMAPRVQQGHMIRHDRTWVVSDVSVSINSAGYGNLVTKVGPNISDSLANITVG